MSKLWILSLVAVVCLSNHPSLTDACSCFPFTPQYEYCHSDLVIKMLVTGPEEVVMVESGVAIRNATQEEKNDNWLPFIIYRRYPYTLEQLYKGTAPSSGYAYTSFHSSLCGARLWATGSIIMMGAGTADFGGEPSVTFHYCMYMTDGTNVDKHIRKLFQFRNHPKLCDCEIEYCYDEGCTGGPASSVNACPPVYRFGSEIFCYWNIACWRKNGICAWKITKDYESCIEYM